MSDRKFYSLMGVGLFLVLSFAVYRQIVFTKACTAKGGETINTRSGYLCLRPESIIK